MKKYIIKATYLEGIHKGKEYFIGKGGYIVTNLDYVWQDSSYTLATCKAVCTRKKRDNDAEAIFEKRQRERRLAEGKKVSKYPLYEMQSFEPYAIETVDK